MNIFVGNLAFNASEEQLRQIFEEYGKVLSAVIVTEKEKKAPKSRGFGFVEMPDEARALEAIASLNNREFMGRLLKVNVSRPKTEAQHKSELRKRAAIKNRTRAKEKEKLRRLALEEKKKSLLSSFSRRPGKYRGGRRTSSYIKRLKNK